MLLFTPELAGWLAVPHVWWLAVRHVWWLGHVSGRLRGLRGEAVDGSKARIGVGAVFKDAEGVKTHLVDKKLTEAVGMVCVLHARG